MNFSASVVANGWLYGAFLPVAMIWLWSLRTAPWRRLSDSRQLNVWLGTIVSLALIWSMKADLRPGLALHLLGATAFVLMFGRQLAIIGLSLVLAAVTFNSATGAHIEWQAYALNALMTVVVPVFVAWGILRAVERCLPAHIFVYIFVVTFFGAAVNVVVTGFAATLLLGLASAYPLAWLLSEYALPYVLLAFAEAWLTGAVITVMIVYLPDWVGSFDDRRYLWGKQGRS